MYVNTMSEEYNKEETMEFIYDNLGTLSDADLTYFKARIIIMLARALGVNPVDGCQVCGDTYDKVIERGVLEKK